MNINSNYLLRICKDFQLTTLTPYEKYCNAVKMFLANNINVTPSDKFHVHNCAANFYGLGRQPSMQYTAAIHIDDFCKILADLIVKTDMFIFGCDKIPPNYIAINLSKRYMTKLSSNIVIDYGKSGHDIRHILKAHEIVHLDLENTNKITNIKFRLNEI